MNEAVKQEIHQLVDECENDAVLAEAKNLLETAAINNGLHKSITEDTATSLTSESKSSLDEVFGIWKNRDISLNKIREQQWRRRAE